MAKKKTTTKKKATANKTATKKSGPAKTAPRKTASAAAGGKKTTARKAAPAKKAGSAVEPAMRRFDAWKPEKPYTPPVGKSAGGEYSAPPFDAGISRDILFRKFDIDFAAVAKAPESAAPPRKPVSREELIRRNFGAWKPAEFYAPPADAAKAGTFSAPPFGDGVSRDVRFRKFDFDFAAVAKEPEPAAPPRKPVSREELIRRNFGAWKPAEFYAPPADAAKAGTFSAPPFGDGVSRDVRFRKFDFDFEELARQAEQKRAEEETARKKAEEEKRAAEETARKKAEEEKRAAEEAARKKAEEEKRAAEEAARKKAEEEKRAAEEAARKKAEEEKRAAEETARKKAEEEKRAAEETARKKAEEEKRAAEEAARKKAEEEKRAAEEAARKKAEEEKRAAEEAARKKAEEEKRAAEEAARKKAEEEKLVAEKAGRKTATVINLSEIKEDGPMDRKISFFAAGIALLFILMGVASYSNSSKYYLETTADGIQIWQGRFSPIGKKMLFHFPGVQPPEEIRPVYSRNEAFSFAFDYFMTEVDHYLHNPVAADIGEIRSLLEQSRQLAVTDAQKVAVARHQTYVDLIVHLYQANAAAGRGTQSGLETAAGILKKAAMLRLSPEQAAFVEGQIELVRELSSRIAGEAPTPAAHEAAPEAEPAAHAPETAPADDHGDEHAAPVDTPPSGSKKLTSPIDNVQLPTLES
jgi:hypothetical protein